MWLVGVGVASGSGCNLWEWVQSMGVVSRGWVWVESIGVATQGG